MKGSGFIILSLFLASSLSAQWNTEWQSNQVSSSFVSGWLNFQKSGDDWSMRFYTITDSEFSIMSSSYSNSIEYIYQFTPSEILAGYQLYSVGADLTGDGITEFYVLGYEGSTDNYRQRLKIFDIVSGMVLLELNDESYFFTYPVIWDPDDDGNLECTLARYDYPNFTGYTYLVYNTGVPVTGAERDPEIPKFQLKQNFPNPFNPSTTIEFSVPKPSEVRVDIFDIQGELIRTILNEHLQPGQHRVVWNGLNKNGIKVSSGAYFYQIQSASFTEAKKMLFVK